MSKINDVNEPKYPQQNQYQAKAPTGNDIKLDDISILYTTDKTEEKRSDFPSTFENTPLNNEEDGTKFLNGLIENKAVLKEKLGLTCEQYDSLACIALGLASQETGMGKEDGYVSENEGAGKTFRQIAKWFDVHVRGNGSASSGLTQMKIYDFLNSDKLTDSQKEILTDLGVEAKGVATNNLYLEPDKAGIATMVVLTSLVDNYDDYKATLENSNKEIASKINDGLTPEQRQDKGNEILTNISNIYQNSTNEEKKAIRANFKEWMLSKNDSQKGDKGVDDNYNEEIQLEELNKALDGKFEVQQSDLNYIRYALTSSGEEMNVTEYCAYAWNKGTSGTGMQLDRLLADKIGIILSNPEDFDYDQFTVNVTTLAQKYAQQSNSANDINQAFIDDLYG